MDRLLGQDVAKLVLGYLHNEGLDEAYNAFCKTSPHLQEEYRRVQRGFPSGQLFGTYLVDQLIENIELKDCITRFVGSLSTSIKQHLPSTFRAKLKLILSSIDKAKFRLVLKRRRSSTEPDTSPEATQTRDLPGHKRVRMSSNTLVIQNENTPAAVKAIPTCSLSTIKKPSTVCNETSNDESESDNRSEAHTEIPILQVLSETILENSEFQNVLVQNINRILQSPDQPIGSHQNQNASASNEPNVQADRSYQDQIDTAVNNIMKVTEENPLFDSLINEIFYNKPDAGNNRKQNAPTSTPQKSDESNGLNIPLKQRLRQRKSTIDQTHNDKKSEIPKTTRKRDLNKSVTVLSNETIYEPEKALKKPVDIPAPQIFLIDPANGTITAQPQLLEQNDTVVPTTNTSSTSTDNYFIGLNPPQSYQVLGSWQSVVVNNSGTITYTDNPNQQYYEPGSIINFDAIHVNMPPATNTASSQPLENSVSIIDDEIIEAVKNIPMTSRKTLIQDIEPEAETPPVSVQLSDVKNKVLSTPRRISHIRALDFNDALTGKIEAVRSLQEDFTDNEVTTASMSYTIPTSAPPKLIRNSGPEATSTSTSTGTQLNDAILKQDSLDNIHFARDIDEDTVVSVESIPDTPSRPKIERNPRQLSARKSSKAETTCQQPLRKSKRKQIPASVVSAASQPAPEAKIVETEPKKGKKYVTAPMLEWERLRSVKPGEWDNHMREQFCRTGKATTFKRGPRKKKQKITKNTSLLQVSINSKDSSIRTISPNSSLTEEHGQLLADNLASAKKNPTEPNPEEAIAGALDHPLLDSDVTDKIIKQLPKRTRHIKIRFSPSKSVKKRQSSKKSSKTSIKITSEVPASSNSLQKQQQNDEIIISPIDTIKKLPASSNMSQLLETPHKNAASDGIPFTPRFALPSKCQETPLLKQMRLQSDNVSAIKFSQFPTPSFPITPGFALTPLSKECSPRIGPYGTRPTDYSSSSSYYRPDESDDIDKNLDALIKSGRIHDIVPTKAINVEPTVTSNSTQKLDTDYLLNCSDASVSSSSQSSSSETSSSSSSSSSENNEADDNVENSSDNIPALRAVIQPGQSELEKQEQPEFCSILTESPVSEPKTHTSPIPKLTTMRELQEMHQKELEKKRIRVKSSLNFYPPIEKFKPKGTIINQKGKLARNHGLSAAVASAQQKPISYVACNPSTSNPTAPTIIAAITPSKRKVGTPRKVIRSSQVTTNSADAITFVTKTDIPAKPNLDAKLGDNKIEKQYNKCGENAISGTIQTTAKRSNISENIQRITKEQITLKTNALEVCDELTSRSNASSVTNTSTTQSKTPKAIIMKPERKDTTSRLPRKITATCIDTLHHCFGDGTMSESDYIDTPVKKAYGYDERCPDVLPAVSLMPTPHKVSPTLKCLVPKTTDKQPDITREKKSPAKIIPSSSPIMHLKPQPVKALLCDQIPSVSPACLQSTPKITMDLNDSSASDDTDSDEDPYKECSLSLATETGINCAYQIVLSSVEDSIQQAISTRQPLTIPILNYVGLNRQFRISVTDDIELFSAEPDSSTVAPNTSITKSNDTKNQIIELPSQSNKTLSSECGKHRKQSVPDVKIKTVQIQKGCVDLVDKRKAKAAASAKSALPDIAGSVVASKSAQPLHFSNMDINYVLEKIHQSCKK